MCAGIDTSPDSLFLQLERPETNQHNDIYGSPGGLSEDDELASTFRHDGWKRNRKLVYQSLRRTLQSKSRVANFNECGATAYVYRAVDDPAKFRLGGSSCRDRFCVPCSIDRSRCLATNVLKTLGKRPARFVTLTLRQTDAHLRDILDRLYDSFRKLRARSFWKHRVKGGCAFIEIKYNAANDAWNVHLHAIVHGRFIPKRDLSAEWYKITGDSFIVDVRAIENEEKIARYVVKYCSKPCNNTFLNRKDFLDTVVIVMVGRRLCLTFGDWRGISLTESPNETDWISLGSFHTVVTKAAQGDRECLAAVHAICRDKAAELLAAAQNARPPPEEKPTN
ncbi:hypothetical protein LCGC14_2597990, partial [marine sediment metagenome]